MRNLSALFLTSMVVSVAYGQTSIQGVVKDGSSMISMPGVTISIKGKAASTKTDATGKFQLNASPTDSLVFNFLGYRTQTVYIGNQTQLSVFLENDNKALEEVVVIGYGTQKKADLTGSISSLKSADITKQPATSAMQSIQGKAAGLNIIANEAPGSSPNVIIRGLGTALGGRTPLYIVDGIAQEDINNISPLDIESIDVLKDASSASIYGLRAANGVIMVTTKKGKSGAPVINYESYAGMKKILNRVKMANGEQFRTYFNENLTSLGIKNWKLEPNQPNDTDWYDEMIQTGTVFNNAVNISGGSESVDYFVSANNFVENGILDGSKYVRNTIRNNNVYKFLNNRLKFTQNLNLTLTNATPKPYSAFTTAYKQSPLVPLMYPNGRYGIGRVNQSTGIVGIDGTSGQTIGNLNTIGNPVYEVLRQNDRTNTLRLQGSIEGEFKITDYLKINSRIGGNKFYSKQRIFTDIKDRWLNSNPLRSEADFYKEKSNRPKNTDYADNSLKYENLEQFRWAWENFLTFTKSFDKHNIEAVVGMSREKFDINSLSSQMGYNVPAQEQYWNINLSKGKTDGYDIISLQTNYTPRALVSYFGRLQYNYDSRYYLTATFRRDASSVFKNTAQYWGSFPSFGFGWTASNEQFMKDVSWVNFLKIRGNYGHLGNQKIPLNTSTVLSSPESSNYNYVFGPEQDLVYGSAYGTPAVNLGWEVTKETGAGLDFTLFNNLSGSVDYYHKLNSNTILDVTPTYTSPSEKNFFDHGAKVVNQGVEIVLNWNKAVNPDFSYSFGVNYAYNNNKVTEVKPAYDGATGGSLNNGEITKQLRAGQPIYAWWMFEADGVFQDANDIANSPSFGPAKPGYLKYKDQNGDGVIDSRDKKFFGSFLPTSTYGINLGINYKAIDFSVSGYGVAGNKVYNGLKSTRTDGGENIALSTFENRWTGPGSTNIHPGAERAFWASSYFLESGSYFRINNITLGYTFNRLYSAKSKLRLYVTAQNPFMFTNYSGFSPELAGDGSPNLTSGIELSAYPTTRNFLFGLNMQF